MNARGWNLNALQNPDAWDLKETAEEVSASKDKGSTSSTAALYGMAAQIPDKSLVDEMTYEFLDACYAEPPQHCDCMVQIQGNRTMCEAFSKEYDDDTAIHSVLQ
ncbi:hypothetical protein DICVIV_08514 [Dictyocaulus viviparus]|uniref:Uncharacterized protein n=1 Tax=Dictyocaulus viviparus TaxID=29172 RepID=A0A0D8XLM3_DICVI|nr:hypothetical protein DICVIV_08514 [Dictyocaulus viviparus]